MLIIESPDLYDYMSGYIVRDGSVTDMLSTCEIVWVLNDPSKGQKILCEYFKLESLLNDQNELIAAIDLEILPIHPRILSFL